MKTVNKVKELEFFRRQFLLTVHGNFNLPWKSIKILNYNLYYHPELEFEHVSNMGNDLYLLGFIFDYENPEYSNKEILNYLSNAISFDHFLERLAKYSGHYVIIYKNGEKIILLNDACAQQEIYYDTLFSTFGTQPKLLSKVISLIPHNSEEASSFYSSSTFLTERIFIGETTHIENIKHLLPNHYIDVKLKSIFRFFPKNSIKPIALSEASEQSLNMLRGYIKAVFLRSKICMSVTGGYDSRTLFLASLNVDCKYYVTKLSKMNYKHNDIVIPQKLTKLFDKEFKVIVENPFNDYEKNIQNTSIDFPREWSKPDKEFMNHINIIGNISEIARNSYGYFNRITPETLSILSGYQGIKFVRNEYKKWLERNSQLFSEKGFNLLDMFYWEERMGNWCAKNKTEMNSLGIINYSPFCSHKLLVTLLSTNRKYRDVHFNKLYIHMMKIVSPEASRLPINPSLKKNIIRLLQFIKVFNFLQRLKLRYYLIRF